MPNETYERIKKFSDILPLNDPVVVYVCSINLCRPGFGDVTALHIAVLRGHLPLVSLLTSAGGHLVLVLLLFLVLAI